MFRSYVKDIVQVMPGNDVMMTHFEWAAYW